MNIIALINPASGSVPADGKQLLASALGSLSTSSQVLDVSPESMQHDFEKAVATRPDLIIVWGGDGTLACALDAAGLTGVPILPLPGGTMNLLHQHIHGGPLDWKSCLTRSVSGGELRYISAGSVAKKKFYVAAMIGTLTKLTEPRELLRDGHPIKALQTLGNSDTLKLDTALLVKASNWDAALEATALAILPAQDKAQQLEIAAIDPDTPVDLAITGLNIATGDWRDAPGVDRRRTEIATVDHFENASLNVTLDGERVSLPSGSKFTKIEKAALVLSAGPE